MSNKLTVKTKIVNVGINTTSSELASAQDKLEINKIFTLNDGTGDGNANKRFHDQRTLGVSANEELDLAGSLADAFGTSLTFTLVKFLWVFAAAGNTNDVLVGGAVTNAFLLFEDATDKIALEPGGSFMFSSPAGKTVTAGTGDLLRIENSAGGTGVTYDIVIVGE